MKKLPTEGFREVGHGADAALEVWATDLPGLFRQAAQGLYALMGATGSGAGSIHRKITLSRSDNESLMVAFLSQLLIHTEQEQLVFSRLNLEIHHGNLTASLEGSTIHSIQREIKAVTFNDLAIRQEDQGYRVLIVFDL